MWQPQNVEAILHVVSITRLGATFFGSSLQEQRGSGAGLHIASMVLLAIMSLALDKARPHWFNDHPLYTFRTCGQAGLAQGLLALPSLATAIFIATRSWWWQLAARLFLASSFQVLFWFSWTAAAASACSPVPPQPRLDRPAQTPAPPTNSTTRRIPRLFLASAAGGCLLSAASVLLLAASQPPASSPHLLLPGSVFELPRDISASAWALQAALLLATVPFLDHLATDLPRSLTPGEAGILAQALLALAAGGVAYTAAALRQGAKHVLWSPHVVQPDPGMHVPAFCVLVLFWVLLLAACCAAARGGGGASGERSGGDAGDRVAASGPASGGAQGGCAGSKGSGGMAPPARAHIAAESGRLERLLCLAGRTGAAAGAAVCLIMLADLGLWVLGRFVAASSRARLATLAYWFACLALTVPVMYWMSKASAAREQQNKKEEEQEHRQQGKQQQEGEGRQTAGGDVVGKRVSAGSGAPRDLTVGPAQRQSQQARAGAGSGQEVPRPGGRHKRPSSPLRPPRSSLAGTLLRALAVPHIVMRKGYHLLAILLFLPAFGWDVRMLQASLAVAGAVLVAVEALRCLGPAAVRQAIGGFMADFADSRDSGPVYLTHFTLLLGIAVPVWLCEPVCGAAAGAMMAGLYGSEAAEPLPLPAPATNDGPLAPRLSAAAARLLPSCRAVLGLSGLVSLGSGDTAAACVGFLLGRWRLFRGGKKTWEGTLSGAAAMLGSWAVVVWWMDLRWALGWGTWAELAGVTAGVALLEAVTQQLDNVVVPLYYLTHLTLTMCSS